MPRNTTQKNFSSTAAVEYVVDAPNGLRLRNNPDGEVIVILPHKSGVSGSVYETIPEWMEVRTGELSGFVKSEFLRMQNNEPA